MDKIRSLLLVRDEERFLDLVLDGALSLSDRVLALDNSSKDTTPDILRAKERVEYVQVNDPLKTHDSAMNWARTYEGWVFGPDGDELYVPEALAGLREQILIGTYQKYWMVRGHALHVTELEEKGSKVLARGYLSPPSQGITNLYNFAAINCWDQSPNRRRLFHAQALGFRPGYTKQTRYLFHEHRVWEEDPLRCLHLRFLPRSRIEPTPGLRPNLGDRARKRKTNTREVYRQGPLIRKDVTEFFPQGVPPVPGA